VTTLSQETLELPQTLAPPVRRTVLRPRHGWQALDVARLLRYRDLLWFLALRDVQVRYKQTVLGILWAIIQPVVTMVVLSAFFGTLIGSTVTGGTARVPYPIFLYAGLLPWTFFASAVTASSQSLLSNSNLIRKVYFPRLIVPIAAVGAPLVDYAVAFVVLLGMMVWFGVAPTWRLLLLPALVATTVTAALGVGILLAALTTAYRDFRFVVTFLIQIWFFVTPVIYPPSIVPARLRPLLALNPMSGTIEAFRAAVLGTEIPVASWATAAAAAMACLFLGLAYFQRTERRIADVI